MDIKEIAFEQFRPTTLAAMIADMRLTNELVGILEAEDDFLKLTVEELADLVGTDGANELIEDARNEL